MSPAVVPVKSVQYTGSNDSEIAAWLPDGVTMSRYVDLLLLSVPVVPKRMGFPGEVHQGDWMILQEDGRIRRVDEGVYRKTWARRLRDG